jgi:hypothetical protein
MALRIALSAVVTPSIWKYQATRPQARSSSALQAGMRACSRSQATQLIEIAFSFLRQSSKFIVAYAGKTWTLKPTKSMSANARIATTP